MEKIIYNIFTQAALIFMLSLYPFLNYYFKLISSPKGMNEKEK